MKIEENMDGGNAKIYGFDRFKRGHITQQE